jgi:hypothetical protein
VPLKIGYRNCIAMLINAFKGRRFRTFFNNCHILELAVKIAFKKDKNV